MTASTRIRAVAATATALAAGVALYLLFLSGGGYVITAQFSDAGQLVRGGLVDVAGTSVGHISSISLSPSGLADVRMTITDGEFTPLHQGTRAIIRATGQAGVTNRFVQLVPGARSARTLPSGTILTPTQTNGIVDLDEVLDSFGPTARRDLRGLIANSADIFAGSNARTFNQMLVRLEPALGAVDGFTRELAYDRTSLSQLVQTTATAATAVASRQSDLAPAADATATSLGALGREQRPLADALSHLPAFLTRGGATLGALARATTTLTPALQEIPPAARPVNDLLTQFNASLPVFIPVVGRLRSELPGLRASLTGFTTLAPRAVPALQSLSTALGKAMPILRGLRVYGADFVLGIFNGLLGIASGPYNATGHYGKIEFVQTPSTLVSGTLSQLLNGKTLVPGLFQARTGLVAPCPGGAEPPSADGSSPWVQSSKLCNPLDDMPASVNTP